MSFYRTYRPQIIDEIDNLAVRESILRLLSKPLTELPHAFLCSGPRGAGKTTTARLIAKLFNCQKATKRGPCGTCDQCTAIAAGNNLDVLELDAASNRGIDEIRQIRDSIGQSPVAGKFRVYIIDEVHMLTSEAFNALLKTLEEPPPHVIFILATTDPQKVPVTIQSRCVSIVFMKASIEEICNALKRIVARESIDIDDSILTLIAQQTDGSFRDAVKQLELMSFTKGAITPEIARQTLSISEIGSVQQFLELLHQKKTKDVISHIEQLVAKGSDVKIFVVECLHFLESLLVQRIKAPHKDQWSLQDISDMVRVLLQSYTDMKTSEIVHLPLELTVVQYCELSHQHIDSDTTASPAKHNPGLVQSDNQNTHHTYANESLDRDSPGGLKKEQKSSPTDSPVSQTVSSGLLTKEKLVDHWADIIAELKNHNHSISGVMRSTRPKGVAGGIVTIEAFFTFHKDKLSETKTRELLATVLYKLFGEKVKVEIVLGKK